MNRQYFVIRGDKRFGPFSEEKLAALAAAGQVTRGDAVWWQGLPQAVRADTLPGLFAAPPGPPPTGGVQLPPAPPLPRPAASEGPPAEMFAVTSMPGPVGRPSGRPARRRSHDGLKLLAMVAGLGGLVAIALAVLLLAPWRAGAKSLAARPSPGPSVAPGSKPSKEEVARAALDEPASASSAGSSPPQPRFDKPTALASLADEAVERLIDELPLGRPYDRGLLASQLLDRLTDATRRLRDEDEVLATARTTSDTWAEEMRAFFSDPPATETAGESAIKSGFRDLTWGDRRTPDFELIGDPGDGALLYKRPGDALRIGDASLLAIVYAFRDERLERVMVRADPGQVEIVERVLRANYGDPALAAGQLNWVSKDTMISLSRATGVILFSQQAAVERSVEQRAAADRRAAEDL